MDISLATVDYLNGSDIGTVAYHAVPANRPEEFLVVEQTGGDSGNRVQTRASIDVDCWSSTRKSAASLAGSVRAALFGMPDALENVFHVEVTTVYNNPDLDSGTPRYTVGADIHINE